MDNFTTWINNNQLLNELSSNDLNQLQHIIIENVFGGFKNMLKHMMKDYTTLSLMKHNQLYNILLTKHDGAIYDNYRQKNDQLCIADVSDDCLLYIMQFLNSNNRFTIQQTCRLFAVLSRQESSFISNFACYQIIPYKTKIIEGLLSDNKQQQLDSIQLLETAPQNFYFDIKNYSNAFSIKIKNIITNNLLNNESCSKLFILELNHYFDKTLLPFAAIILNYSSNRKFVAELLETIVVYSTANTCDIMNCQKLVTALFLILQNLNKFDTKQPRKPSSIFDSDDSSDDFPLFMPRGLTSPTPKENIVKYCCKIFGRIYDSQYESFRMRLLQRDIICSLHKLWNSLSSKYKSLIIPVLKKLFLKLTRDEFDFIINNKNAFASVTSVNFINQAISLNVIRLSNNEQRRNIIHKICDNFKNVTIKKSVKKNIMKIIYSGNDMKLCRTFNKIEDFDDDPFADSDDSDDDDDDFNFDFGDDSIEDSPLPSLKPNEYNILPFHVLPAIRNQDETINATDLKPWIKMRVFGVPEAAIRLKMRLAGFNEDVIERCINQQNYNDDDNDNKYDETESKEFERFRKMIKLGVPESAVRSNMLRDGYDDDAFDIHIHVNPPRNNTVRNEVKSVTLYVLETLEIYIKMLKYGVPPNSVKQKMLNNGHTQQFVGQLFEQIEHTVFVHKRGNGMDVLEPNITAQNEKPLSLMDKLKAKLQTRNLNKTENNNVVMDESDFDWDSD
eukprot:481211_1